MQDLAYGRGLSLLSLTGVDTTNTALIPHMKNYFTNKRNCSQLYGNLQKEPVLHNLLHIVGLVMAEWREHS